MEAGLTLRVLGVHLGPGLYEELHQVVVSLPGREVDGAVSNLALPCLQLFLSGAEEEFPGDWNIADLNGEEQGNVSFLGIINSLPAPRSQSIKLTLSETSRRFFP